jgi:hypothetical protein
MSNNNMRYHYKKRGLQIIIYSNKNKNQKSRMIVSPDFIELLNIITDDKNNFNYDLWNNLTQEEKNFMFKIDELCIPENEKNRKLELVHLKESQSLVNRLKLLEGTMHAGNTGDKVINESINIIQELMNRNQISNVVGSKMINKIYNLKSSAT